jgi:hypothetical protein
MVMKSNKQKRLLVDRFVDTHHILLNNHFPGLVDEVAILLVASLCNVERVLSNPLSIANAEQILVCTVNVLVDPNNHDLYETKVIVILVLDAYFGELTKSPLSQKMMPNMGDQTPRICNAVALALKSSLFITECDDVVILKTKCSYLFIGPKAFIPDMISLKSEEGK